MAIKIETTEPKKLRGLAMVSPERRKEIAAMGGKSIPKEKRPFAKNRDAAVEAGRKGGAHKSKEKRTFAVNRELAKLAGTKSKRKKKDGNSHQPVADTRD